MLGALGAASGVGTLEAGQCPLGDRVGQGACQMEGGEGVEAFYAAAGFADASDPRTVASEVFGVYLVHLLRTDLFLGLSNTAGGFDAGDGRLKGGAGDPETRRHLAAAFVLYHARPACRTPGGNAER